jgi:putative ABC transport system permease protein
MLRQLRTALRSTWKNRSTNAINITGLAAGMTSAILIFLWVGNELTFDNYHHNADRIHRVTSYIGSAKWTWSTAPLPLVSAIRTAIPEAESVTAFQDASNILVHKEDNLIPENHCAYIDSAWFNVFHYDFIAGSPQDFFSNPFSLILTRTKAKQYFGDNNPIGRTLRIDTVDYKVAAVIKDIPTNSSFQYDFLLTYDALLSSPSRRKDNLTWGNYNNEIYIRLKPGTQTQHTTATLTRILRENAKDDPESKQTSLSLINLKDIHFETDLTFGGLTVHANRSTVTIFSILGVFLLVIACINYVNLTTARASLRAKEVGIRKVIGAGRTSLFFQFILESLLISILALGITIALVSLTLPAFRNLTDKSFANPFANPQTWQIIAITLLAATALNGIYPALLLSSFKPLNTLRGAAALKFKDVFLRKGLVVVQFTFSIILIIGTLVIQRQLYFVQHTDPGYNRSQVLSVLMPFVWSRSQEEQLSLRASIKHEIQQQTGVAGVTFANSSIISVGGASSGGIDWEGHDTSFKPTVYHFYADKDYQKVMQLQMTQGHWFDAPPPGSRGNLGVSFVLNETAVKTLNIHQPVIGQRFILQEDSGRIVGVVKDFHFQSLHDKIKPLAICNDPRWCARFFIKTESGKAPQVLAAVKALAKRYEASKPLDYAFLDDQFDALYKTDQKVSTLILTFSGVAIVISCLGLLALAAFTAQQRIKEIGIRKVLGATIPNIITLLSRDFIRLVGLSILIATPIAAWAMHSWLANFAYHIPLTAGFFLIAGLLALFIAVLTVSSQSLKAATTNPAKSLRTD